jgi:penicillin-binding protein 1A
VTKFDPGLTDLPPEPNSVNPHAPTLTEGSDRGMGEPEGRDRLETLPPEPPSERPARRPSPLGKILRSRRRPQNTTPTDPQPSPKEPKPFKLPRLGYGFWLGILFLSSTNIFAWASWRTLQGIVDRLPDPNEIPTFSRDGTITIRAADGTILQQRGPASRQRLALEALPEALPQAFIASEDRRFYEHNGIDVQGILRAGTVNLMAGDVVEGGSTITQQLARIVFLNQERSASRKFREALMSLKIEKNLEKDEILEHYLNYVYLGSGAYGVADAAWVYFSKRPSQLTLGEMALLASLAPAPSQYSPLINPDLAIMRRNQVLDRLQRDGMASDSAIAIAKAAPLDINPQQPPRLLVRAPYFTSFILQELPKYVPADAIEAGGLTVETTLRADWQDYADEAVRQALETYGKWQNFRQASLVAIDPRNGEIRAMVGGLGFLENQFNRVTQARRQPGSTFKGIVYAAAVQAGLNPNATYVDAPYKVGGYEPKNYGRTYSGTQTVVAALTKSINVIALKILLDTGIEPTIELARKMGVTSRLEPTYALALGAYEMTLLELVSAYGTFAAKGKHFPATGIRRVLDRRGQVLYEAAPKPVQAMTETDAAIMTNMLRNVVTEGTGRPATLPRPVAGKTGTSDQARDLWFIGFVPQMAAGVWLGNDNSRPTWGSSGAAAATWRMFSEKALEGFKVEPFPSMPDLSKRRFRPRKRQGQTAGEGTRVQRESETPRTTATPQSGTGTPARSRRESAPRQESAPARSGAPASAPKQQRPSAPAPVAPRPSAPAPAAAPPPPAAPVAPRPAAPAPVAPPPPAAPVAPAPPPPPPAAPVAPPPPPVAPVAPPPPPAAPAEG